METDMWTGPDIWLEKHEKRVKKGDFWGGLQYMSFGDGVMADWEWALGSALPLLKPLLRPTGEQSGWYPCKAWPECECRHEVQDTDFGLIATCMCEDSDCSTFPLEPKDILLYGLDFREFADGIRRALGFAEPDGSPYCSRELRQIGVYAAVAAPVYLSMAGKEALLRELAKLVSLREGPFVLLTATGRNWEAEVEGITRAQGAAHIALSSVLEVKKESEGVEKLKVGKQKTEIESTSPLPSPPKAERVVFTRNASLEPMLAEFARRVASLRAGSGTLLNIHQEIAAVRKDFGELRSAKQRLEKMLADGLFAFTRKVDPRSFQAFCTILAEGDISKAARALGMGDSTLRDMLRAWAERGDAYRRMLDVVRWRKQVGRTDTVRLNENIILGKAESTDHPGLLSDLLDGLLSMTAGNWEDLSAELAEMLRAQMGRWPTQS